MMSSVQMGLGGFFRCLPYWREEQFFDFSFGDSGYTKAAITKCEIDYTGVTLDPNAIDGLSRVKSFMNA